jgi:chemotaxis protein MotB
MGKPKKDTGTWLMTYADLVTALMAFFVLLYTLTPGVEEKAFNAFIEYFQKHSGLLDMNNQSPQSSSNVTRPEQIQEYMEEQASQWQALTDYLKEEQIEDEVEISMTSEGILITLSDSLTFESGSSALLPKAKEILGLVGKTISQPIAEVEVQGHTDNVPINRNSKYESNWYLGAARAVSVVQYLQSNADIDPDQFKASSFGEYRPMATNLTVEGRRTNRRVEIYLRKNDVLSEMIREEIFDQNNYN